MKRPTDDVEYEQMLLGRHDLAHHRGGRHRNALLERSAYVLLSRIRAQGPMSNGELSEAFGLDASTLNRQTAAAARAGLVERIPDPEGGMARKFRITDRGAGLLDQERERVVRALDRVMHDWAEEDIAAFAAHLQRFNCGIERLSGRPWPRPRPARPAAGGVPLSPPPAP
ncbi:MarR family transcriptional regulator [Streptomyces sp. NPDC002793]|uniref:MarR family winged helix-turn-helix transcriptional regulator n=1 Tax=Streptomyces sp. NPDC002793 TaxID=3154432 RepID=UPI003327BF42